MRIAPGALVRLRCQLADLSGRIVSPEEDLEYVHGTGAALLAAVERALEGHVANDEVAVTLDAADAYGEYDPLLVRVEPRSRLPPEIAVGQVLNGGTLPTLDGEVLQYRVIDVNERDAVLDANHFLAGKTLRVRCRILAVKPAPHIPDTAP